jgi:acylphosphatase
MTMKLKVEITGPKVHDVGYRYFLFGLAMSLRSKMLEAHNAECCEGDEVLVLAEGDDEAVKAFRALVETKRLIAQMYQISSLRTLRERS